MIIGRDILKELGIDIKFLDKTITWDNLAFAFHVGDESQSRAG